MFTDIHSHDPQLKSDQLKVLSLQLHPDTDLEEWLGTLPEDLRISAGVHPWHASEWTIANIPLLEPMLLHSRILFVGEIGLDAACSVSFDTQSFVFETQLKIAEKSGKSVLIHNVGHQSELLAEKRAFKRIPAWVLHGFRGKAPMVEQFIRKGFYLSFGLNYHVEALRACPLDRLLLETDDSKADIGLLYQKVSDDLEVSVALLEDCLSKNVERLSIK